MESVAKSNLTNNLKKRFLLDTYMKTKSKINTNTLPEKIKTYSNNVINTKFKITILNIDNN